MGFAYSEDNDSVVEPKRPAGQYVIFAFFTATGLLALAGTILLPEYAALDDLQARRDALAHQARCDEKLSAYNARMIRATREDPVLIARLMIRHGNYRPAGCETVEMKSVPPEQSVPERLLRESGNPPKRKEPRLLAHAGLWLADTTTSKCMILLALAMIVIGAIAGRGEANRRPTFTS
ncbi:MAG: hypothetical protein KAV00_11780 [Phycisphaerae bacterium]|nr:hypothetical protein [Phycisphaerae bacterium]